MTASTSDKSPPRARPLSPHLQIWRFTVTMAASITQRATGVANFAGVALLAAWLVAAARGPEAFAPLARLLTSPLGLIVLAGFVWSLSFHMLNGMRYLYWDSGRGFALRWARATGWAVYVASFVLTAIILFAGHAVRSGA